MEKNHKKSIIYMFCKKVYSFSKTNNIKMKNWNNKTTVKKGDYAENIVKEHLNERGILTMVNSEEEQAHPFDFLLSRKRDGVWALTMADVKCKPQMIKYNGSGIDEKHFNTYLYLQEKYHMKFYLYFVDETAGKCYGNYLDRLIEEQKENGITYPCKIRTKRGEDLIIFHQSNMKFQFTLSEIQVDILKSLSTSNY